MKRVGNLFNKIWDRDNLLLAHKNARKGKTHYKEVKLVDSNLDYYIDLLEGLIKNKTFKNSPYKIFTKVEHNKERTIYKLPYFPDRIVHHAIMQVLEPIWKKTLIRDTYQSIKGRGVSDGKRRIEYVIRKHKPKYYLKIDVKKFYPSIDNDILMALIEKKIKCKETLELLKEIVYSTEGVPIGNYLSQYFGNLYLTYFDHKIKETQKWYYRYCDDIIVLNDCKSILHRLVNNIVSYLTNLKLEMKSNWRIDILKGLDYLGYRFYHTHTLLRKSIIKAFKVCIFNSLPSYWGWIQSCNANNLWVRYQCS